MTRDTARQAAQARLAPMQQDSAAADRVPNEVLYEAVETSELAVQVASFDLGAQVPSEVHPALAGLVQGACKLGAAAGCVRAHHERVHLPGLPVRQAVIGRLASPAAAVCTHAPALPAEGLSSGAVADTHVLDPAVGPWIIPNGEEHLLLAAVVLLNAAVAAVEASGHVKRAWRGLGDAHLTREGVDSAPRLPADVAGGRGVPAGPEGAVWAEGRWRQVEVKVPAAPQRAPEQPLRPPEVEADRRHILLPKLVEMRPPPGEPSTINLQAVLARPPEVRFGPADVAVRDRPEGHGGVPQPAPTSADGLQNGQER
eukprot:CAMPEP_0175756982 /NCGR_PEP_ID=MMETSP0097-20121207/64223_1 /TAXON_ID=311494 /ORGANISM="Alexandrium monilatum, Strain CCMP3105" /LENGTH=312 /DNA_ID=CAMNT_0017066139 /DNA_START=85 /DNA_END=1022 /DNA_ORIENTATION=+